MGDAEGAAAVGVLTFVKAHWRVAAMLGVVLILALGGVQWCRTPSRLPPVEETTKPAKDKIDRATEDRLRTLLAERERALAKQRDENVKLRRAAEAKATAPFETAVKGGTHAMAELATLWTAPGTAEQLRARWRPAADPANPSR